MRIGFCYDAKDDYLALGFTSEQVAECDSEYTIASIAAALSRMGFDVDRVGHIQNLVTRLAHGDRWDLVFNFAEGMHGAGREAAVPALLDAYQIPYVFSGPVTMAITLDKSIAKRLVAAKGVPTADYAIVNSLADITNVKLPFPLFAKPLAEGSGKGVLASSHVTNAEELRAICADLLQRFNQPVLVERFLPGREFTVGILGSGDTARSIGALEVLWGEGSDPHSHSYDNKNNCLTVMKYELATDAEGQRAQDIALAAWKALGCHDGGRIDLRSDANGVPHFLEANPLSGLNPDVSDIVLLARDAGMDYDQLMREILREACARHGLKFPGRASKPKVA